MCKIGILFENRDFEHDVYELIKAFYPEAEIHTLYENAEAEYDLRLLYLICLGIPSVISSIQEMSRRNKHAEIR